MAPDRNRAVKLAQSRFKERAGRRKRSFISLEDLSPAEARQLISDGLRIKASPNVVENTLRGRAVALLFEKTSTRTRSSFDAASRQMGGSSTYVEWRTTNFMRADLGDEVRTLSRFYDFIVARVNQHETLKTMVREAEVPIINGLSDLAHPCQALSDYLTMMEYFGDVDNMVIAYIGDNNNVCRSLAHGTRLFNVKMRIATPPQFRIEKEFLEIGSGSIHFFTDPKEAVVGADVIYTDTWVSMGDEAQEQMRLAAFTPYQVNEELLTHAPPQALVMHCLPALPGREISPTCLRFDRSIVFDQAENRLHTQKALLAWLNEVNQT